MPKVIKFTQELHGGNWRGTKQRFLWQELHCGRSQKRMTKIHFLKLRSPFQGDFACNEGSGKGSELTRFSAEKQRRMDYMMNPGDKPYLQEAACLGGSHEGESLRFVNPR